MRYANPLLLKETKDVPLLSDSYNYLCLEEIVQVSG